MIPQVVAKRDGEQPQKPFHVRQNVWGCRTTIIGERLMKRMIWKAFNHKMESLLFEVILTVVRS